MMVYRLPKIYPKPIQIHLEVHYHIIMNVFVVLYLFEVKPVLMFVPVVSVFHKIKYKLKKIDYVAYLNSK